MNINDKILYHLNIGDFDNQYPKLIGKKIIGTVISISTPGTVDIKWDTPNSDIEYGVPLELFSK